VRAAVAGRQRRGVALGQRRRRVVRRRLDHRGRVPVRREQRIKCRGGRVERRRRRRRR
jgi:hypothetical protein